MVGKLVFSLVLWLLAGEVFISTQSASVQAGIKRRVLISAFKPFGGDDLNTSEHLLKTFIASLEKKPELLSPGDVVVESVVLNADDSAFDDLLWTIQGFRPDIVIATGVNQLSWSYFSLEDSASDPEAPRQPISPGQHEFISISAVGPQFEVVTAPPAQTLHGSLPFERIQRHLNRSGFSAVISHDPGTSACGKLYYRLLEWMKRAPGSLRPEQVGFVHVPDLETSKREKLLAPWSTQNATALGVIVQTALDEVWL